MDRKDRMAGVLFGVACGDALGATLEFTILEKNHKMVTDIVGGGVFNLKPGETTDDTAMTLMVAEGILENSKDPINTIGNKFVEWANSSPKDIGIICLEAINNFNMCGDWMLASKITHQTVGGLSAGNGTLMRTAPIAFYSDYNEMVKQTRNISKMTHWDDKASDACIIYNKIIYKLLNGEDKDKSILSEIQNTQYVNVLKMEKNDLKPSGYVVDTFNCVLWCCLANNNFKDAIIEIANLCGDADTTAAIAGGLMGAAYGLEGIPNEWVNKIIIKDDINNLLSKFNSNEKFNK